MKGRWQSTCSKYPGSKLRQRTSHICCVGDTGKTEYLGVIRTLNVFMLEYEGHSLPGGASLWKDCISRRLPSPIVRKSLVPFGRAREEVSHVNVG
ncbi:MAG: hypothetical protein R6V59_04380 [Dehalococcoidia bacterium]